MQDILKAPAMSPCQKCRLHTHSESVHTHTHTDPGDPDDCLKPGAVQWCAEVVQ